MVTPNELRSRFKHAVGPDAYLRFIKALHRLPKTGARLRFWQQDTWDSFVSANPDCDLAIQDLIDALRLCELHEVEMQAVDVRACRDHFDFVQEYEQDMVKHFPHAKPDRIMVSADHKEPTIQTWFCPECDRVLDTSRWRTIADEPCDDPKSRSRRY